MEIKTKYSLGDMVYPISHFMKYESLTCECCSGAGRAKLEGLDKTVQCPECYGKGYISVSSGSKWHVSTDSASHVGKINAEVYIDPNKGGIKYMLEATGIGSGTNWPEERLFPSRLAAQEACDVLNKESEPVEMSDSQTFKMKEL